VQINKAVYEVIIKRWDTIWALGADSSLPFYHLFIPSVNSAKVLDAFPPSADVAQLLSGHCKLRKFLFNIKKIDSPLCLCGEAEETVLHFLFDCPRFAIHRFPLKKIVEEESLIWPPTPSLIISLKKLWLATQKFVKATNRFTVASC